MTEKPRSSYWIFQASESNLINPFWTVIIRAEQIKISVGEKSYHFTTVPFYEGDQRIGSVPSRGTLEAIVDLIEETSVESFWVAHEQAVDRQLKLLARGNYRAIGIYPSMIEMCKKMKGFSAVYYCFYKAIIYYCESIFWTGKHSTKARIKALKEYRRKLDPCLTSGKMPSNLPSMGETQGKHLKLIPDYQDAKLKIAHYGRELTEAAKNSQQIRVLLIKRNHEHQIFLEELHHDEQTLKQVKQTFKPAAFCPICGNFIEQVTRFRSSCGSDKCKKEYEAVKRAKGRGTVSRELFKHLITKTGKGIRCQICRKRKRVLYTDKFFCFECCLEHKIF
jgi:hypothetical protein